MNRRSIATFGLAILAVLPADLSAAAPRLVEAVLANAPAAAEARCSYTRIKVEDDESRTERYRAGAREPWQLLEVDGREPTPPELLDYQLGAGDRDRRHPLAFDLRSMVNPERWELKSETAEQAVFGFRLMPNEELDARLVEKVRGILVVDKARQRPVRIVIENTEPAYVAPFVRVAEYRQELTFDWEADIGAAALTQAETHMRGRALGIKSLRRYKLVRYVDYMCAGKTAEAAAG